MRRYVFLALTGTCLLAGTFVLDCAYYNTFYNAKKSFSKAEKLRKDTIKNGGSITTETTDLYDEAIENAARVLRDHPDSDLIDDALVLIGDAFVAKKEYPKAVRKYEEVLSNYPDSKLAPYCAFATGRTSLAGGDTARAETALESFMQQYPSSKWTPDAYMLLGDIAFARRQYVTSITNYTRLMTGFPKYRRRPKAQYQIAEAYLAMARNQKALDLFQQVGETAHDRDLEFEAHYMVGECLRRDRQFEAALRKYEQLMKHSSYLEHRPRIMLALASCQQSLDRIDRAFENYQTLTRKYASDRKYTREIAQAYYEMGLISEQRGDLDAAEKMYGDAKKRSPRTFWVSKQATAKGNDIHQLQNYRHRLDTALAGLASSPPDSMGRARRDSVRASDMPPRRIERAIQARLQLAELYLFRFGLPDSALVQYRLVRRESPDRTVAARAAYAEAWILEHAMGDTTASRIAYRRLLTYDDTPYASIARHALSLPDSSGPSDAELFGKAETLLFTAQDPDSASVYYRRIVDRFPEGDYAARALYALGWIAEAYKHDADTALARYMQLTVSYPKTEPGRRAKLKIEAIKELVVPVAAAEDSTLPERTASSPEDHAARQRPDASRTLEAATVGADSSAVTPKTGATAPDADGSP